MEAGQEQRYWHRNHEDETTNNVFEKIRLKKYSQNDVHMVPYDYIMILVSFVQLTTKNGENISNKQHFWNNIARNPQK